MCLFMFALLTSLIHRRLTPPSASSIHSSASAPVQLWILVLVLDSRFGAASHIAEETDIL